MQPDLLDQGLELMYFGMGTVFVFLACLVVATSIMSALVQRYAPEPTLPVKPAPAAPGTADDKQRIAAIIAAIHKYRSRHK